MQQIDAMTTSIEQRAYASMEGEISSQRIGDMVMEELKATNDVAYVRFAAVYRLFTDIGTFMQELQKLLDEGKSKASKMRWMRKKRVPAHFHCTKKEKPLMQLPLMLFTSAWILPRNRTA